MTTEDTEFKEWHRPAEECFHQLRDSARWYPQGNLCEDSLVRRLDQYGQLRKILDIVKESGRGTQLFWHCIWLEASLWDNVKDWLRDKGYPEGWIFWHKGKCGLRGFSIRDAVPALFDDIIITFDNEEKLDKPIPVRLGDKCTLVAPFRSGEPIIPYEYDLIFREPYGKYGNYIVRKDGLYGIIGMHGEVKVPCIMDEIYLRNSPDGCIILMKDGKWGLYNDRSYAPPVYDELEIENEKSVRARAGDTWGWVDMDGQLTQDRNLADFCEWSDEEK